MALYNYPGVFFSLPLRLKLSSQNRVFENGGEDGEGGLVICNRKVY